MFLVINIVDGKLGVIYQEEIWGHAVNCALGMVQEQTVLDENKPTEDEIRNELNEVHCYEGNGFVVHIAQPEN